MSLLSLCSYHKFSALQNSLRQLRRCKSFNVSAPSVQKYLTHLMYENECLLAKRNCTVNEINKLREIKPVINILTEKSKLQKDVNDLDQQIKNEEDEQMREMIREQTQMYRKRMKELDTQIESVLLEPYLTNSGVLLELQATEQENSSVLAKELFDLYRLYADYKGWVFDVVSLEEKGQGINKASIIIEGFGALQLMSIEAGQHHRVASPDRLTLTHISSLVNVAVFPQPDKSEFNIPEQDLVIETKETREPLEPEKLLENSVCVTHVPSSTTIECKTSISNRKNEELATKMLHSLLFQVMKLCDDLESNKKQTPPQNDYVRTYDHFLDRVQEHREGDDTVHRLSRFLRSGELLERLQASVLRARRLEHLLKLVKKYEKKEKQDGVFTA